MLLGAKSLRFRATKTSEREPTAALMLPLTFAPAARCVTQSNYLLYVFWQPVTSFEGEPTGNAGKEKETRVSYTRNEALRPVGMPRVKTLRLAQLSECVIWRHTAHTRFFTSPCSHSEAARLMSAVLSDTVQVRAALRVLPWHCAVQFA